MSSASTSPRQPEYIFADGLLKRLKHQDSEYTYLSLDVAPALEQHTFTSISADEDEIGAACMICLDEMISGDVVTSLPCSHTYHHHCIAHWLNSRLKACQTGCCPACNLRIIVPIVKAPGDHEPSGADENGGDSLPPTVQSQRRKQRWWQKMICFGRFHGQALADLAEGDGAQ